jgi:C-terminal processing protease CtpA/Prc
LRGKRQPVLIALALLLTAGTLEAQIKTELVNWQGATAPCVGIGPVGGPLAKKCASFFQQAGFLRTSDLGSSGLTVGSDSNDTNVVTAVAPDSPAAVAGLANGDLLVSVNGTGIENHPGIEATRMLFGRRDQTVQVRYERDRQQHEVKLSLVHVAVQQPPKLGGFMMVVKPLVNWRGDYVPCSGAGPAYMAAIAYCEKHFSDFGFVKPDDAADAGLNFDETNKEAALVKAVSAASPAENAGIRPGDRIIAIDGKPVPGGMTNQAKELLFGKAGARLQLVYTHQGQNKVAELTLAPASH